MSKEREVIEEKIAYLEGQMRIIEADLDNPKSASRFHDYHILRYQHLEQRLYDLQEILREADESE